MIRPHSGELPRERGFVCRHRGDRYFGILHLPRAAPTGGGAGVMLMQGGEGDRCGPHRILVKCALALAELGLYVLRWDLPDRGESEGTMPEDEPEVLELVLASGVRVMDAFAGETGCEVTFAGGICVGAELALELSKVDERIRYLLLLSPQKTYFLTTDAALLSARFRYHLGLYLRKLRQPGPWMKLVSGRLNWRGIAAALVSDQGLSRRRRPPPAAPRRPANGDLLALWRQNRQRLLGVRDTLAIYGERDPNRNAAGAWLAELCAANNVPVEQVVVAGADHNFCSPDWEKASLEAMASWVGARVTRGGAR